MTVTAMMMMMVGQDVRIAVELPSVIPLTPKTQSKQTSTLTGRAHITRHAGFSQHMP